MYVFIYISERVRYTAVVDCISYFMTAGIVQLTGCACCLGSRCRDVIPDLCCLLEPRALVRYFHS